MTKDAWVASHPYLRGMADLQTLVEAAVAEVYIPTASPPRWNDYIDDFHAGAPTENHPLNVVGCCHTLSDNRRLG
jgi:hypothetical protein